MEIRIKTAEEFSATHVTIEIKADDQEEAAQVSEALTRNKGHVCVPACRPNEHVAFEGHKLVDDLRDNIDWVNGRIKHLEISRDSERDRANDAEEAVEELKKHRTADEHMIEALKASRDRYQTERDSEKERADANREWAGRAEARIVRQTEAMESQSELLNDALWRLGEITRLTEIFNGTDLESEIRDALNAQRPA